MLAPYRIIAIISLTVLVGCSTSGEVQKQKSVDEIFTEAKVAYDNGDWLDALNGFDVIKLQYPASQFADDAQFYLAEINFARGEYIMAAFNYSVVRRSYPSSEFARQAVYKAALCYDKLSLPADRDPENTRKAIQAFSDYQSLYAGDSLARESALRIRDLRDRLAERNMLIAEHYMRTLARKAATAHLDAIIEEFPDSRWVEDAILMKLEILLAQSRTDDARTLVNVYKRLVREPIRAAYFNELAKELP